MQPIHILLDIIKNHKLRIRNRYKKCSRRLHNYHKQQQQQQQQQQQKDIAHPKNSIQTFDPNKKCDIEIEQYKVKLKDP